MANILIIDDDKLLCKSMCLIAERHGHDASYAMTLGDGLALVKSRDFDIVFLDVRLPDGNGLKILPQIKEVSSQPEVIVITASGDPDSAERAVRWGAWDYVEKTASIKDILLPINSAIKYRTENIAIPGLEQLNRHGIIGSSASMEACFKLMAKAVCSDANVLITGETGTGKEIFAKALHKNSTRSCNNFVVVDCTALPETLVESVLFGHEKGAFTGADQSRDGLIKQADNGTLFLDELGELPLSTQKRFLRVLQERSFRPIGGKTEIKSDFRLIAATHKDLYQMTDQNKFREDLLFRVCAMVIELPPLRKRPEDIISLAQYHTDRLCSRYNIEKKAFSSNFIDTISSYDWPGNVRELFNTLEASIAQAITASTLYARHLPVNLRVKMARNSISENKTNPEHMITPDESCNIPMMPIKDYRQSMESKYLKNLLQATEGNIKKSLEVSGLSRSRLYELISKYKLSFEKS
jgi:two-component system NtrC family response regulator